MSYRRPRASEFYDESEDRKERRSIYSPRSYREPQSSASSTPDSRSRSPPRHHRSHRENASDTRRYRSPNYERDRYGPSRSSSPYKVTHSSYRPDESEGSRRHNQERRVSDQRSTNKIDTRPEGVTDPSQSPIVPKGPRAEMASTSERKYPQPVSIADRPIVKTIPPTQNGDQPKTDILSLLMKFSDDCAARTTAEILKVNTKRNLTQRTKEFEKTKPQHEKFPLVKERQTANRAKAQEEFDFAKGTAAQKLKQCEKTAEELAARMMSGSTNSSNNDEDYKKLQGSYVDLLKKPQDQEQSLEKLQKDHQQLRQEMVDLKESVNRDIADFSGVSGNIAAVSAEVKELAESRPSLTSLSATVKNELPEFRSDISSLSTKVEDDLRRMRSEVSATKSSAESKSSQIQQLQVTVESNNTILSGIKTELRKQKDKVNGFENTVAELTEAPRRLITLEERAKSGEERAKSGEERAKAGSVDVKKLQQGAQGLQQDIQNLQSRCSQIERKDVDTWSKSEVPSTLGLEKRVKDLTDTVSKVENSTGSVDVSNLVDKVSKIEDSIGPFATSKGTVSDKFEDIDLTLSGHEETFGGQLDSVIERCKKLEADVSALRSDASRRPDPFESSIRNLFDKLESDVSTLQAEKSKFSPDSAEAGFKRLRSELVRVHNLSENLQNNLTSAKSNMEGTGKIAGLEANFSELKENTDFRLSNLTQRFDSLTTAELVRHMLSRLDEVYPNLKDVANLTVEFRLQNTAHGNTIAECGQKIREHEERLQMLESKPVHGQVAAPPAVPKPIESLRQEVDSLTQSVATTRNIAKKAETNVSQIEEHIQKVQEDCQENKQNSEACKETIRQLAEKWDDVGDDIKSCKQQIDEMDVRIQSLEILNKSSQKRLVRKDSLTATIGNTNGSRGYSDSPSKSKKRKLYNEDEPDFEAEIPTYGDDED